MLNQGYGIANARMAVQQRATPLLWVALALTAAWLLFTPQASSLLAGGNAGRETEVLLYPLPERHYEPWLQVTGLGRPDRRLRLELNGAAIAETRTNGSGDFAVRVGLRPGRNLLRVLGGEAETWRSVAAVKEIHYFPTGAAPVVSRLATTAAEAPAPPVLNPPDPVTSDNPVNLSGEALPGSLVGFYVNGRYTRSVEVDISGTFSTWVPLEDGMNSIYATAEDDGGQSPASNTVEVEYTNATPRQWSGTLGEDAVWTIGDGTPYSLTGNLTIPAGVTLWLQPGVQLNVSGNYKLQVRGDLVVAGTAAAPAVLRPTAAACNGTSVERQDWQGIEVLAGATATLEHAEVHCARWGVHFNGGDGAIRHTRLLTNYTGVEMVAASGAAIAPQITAENEIRGSFYGVYVRQNSAPLIAGGNEIAANRQGIYVYGNNSAAQNPAPVVTGNSLYGSSSYNYYAGNFGSAGSVVLDATGNWWGSANPATIASKIYDWGNAASSPVVDYSGYLGEAGGPPAYTGETLNGPIAADRTLTASEYLLLGHVTVAAGATLTIDPGVQLNVPGNYKLQVQGDLVVAGTAAAPAVLRPTAAACNGTSVERQDWQGIEVLAGATATLEHAEVHCARWGVHFNGGDGAIRHTRLLTNYTGVEMVAASGAAIAPQITAENEIRGSFYGVYVRQNSAPLIAGGNEIAANRQGIYVYGNNSAAQNPAPVVTGNSLYGSSSYNYYAGNFGSAGSVVLDATGNWWGSANPATIASKIYDWGNAASSPVVDYSGYLGEAGGPPAYTGETLNGPIAADRTLTASEYLLLGHVTVAAGATLTIDPGVQLNVPGNYKLQVQGDLVVAGTAAAPAVLRPTAAACNGTSVERQDWQGIEVLAGATATLEHAEVHCARWGVHFNGGDGAIRYTRLLTNYTGVEMVAASEAAIAPQITAENEIRGSYYGIYVRQNSAPLISGGNLITGNRNGLYVYGNSSAAQNPAPVVTGNSLYGNSSYNYWARYFGSPGATVLNATGNWWGSAVPSQISASIFDWSDQATQSPVVDYSGYLGEANGPPAYTGETLNGPIAADRTLTANEYLLLGHVTVAAGATLTIDPGVQLNVPGNYKLQVQGDLVVVGSAAAPAVLRPTAAACNGTSVERQDWQGIEVLAGATATLEHAEVHCARWGVHFNGGDGAIRHTRLLTNYTGVEMVAASGAAIAPQITTENEIRGSYYGVYVRQNSAPLISGGNLITGNRNGLYVYGNSNTAQNPAPVVTGNSLYGNSSYNYWARYFGSPGATVLDATGNWWGSAVPSQISASVYDWSDDPSRSPVVDYGGYLGEAGGPPAYTGETLNGPIAADRTLTASEYLLLGHVTVATGATLTIDPGVQLNVPGNYKLQVQGDLVVAGTAAAPAVLRPTAAACNGTSVERQDWQGIEVLAGATATLEHAEVHCARWGVHFNGGDGAIRHTRLLTNYTGVEMVAASGAAIAPQITQENEIRGSFYGIYVRQNSAPLISGGNLITGNRNGLYVYGNSNTAQNPAPVVTGNSLYGNSSYNYWARYFGSPGATVLDATGNWWGTADPAIIAGTIYDQKNQSTSPYVDYGGYLGEAGGPPAYDGETLTGPITADRTLPAGDHRMLSSVVVEAGVTLTLAPGATLKAAPGRKLQVAGTLVAHGAENSRAAFGSAAATPAKGDWYGIEVLETGSVDLDYARIEYASYGLDFNGGQGTVKRSLIRYNTYGIYVRANSSPSIVDGNEITANDYGIYANGNNTQAQNPAPVIVGNSIYGNRTYNYYAINFGGSGTSALNATGNWWGTADAQAIAATIYSSHASSPAVDYSGFLESAPGRLAVVISDVAVTASQIQPLADESAEGTFFLSSAATVTMQIRRESTGSVLYENSTHYAEQGSYAFSWNGRDEQGAIVAPGLYRVLLLADDGMDDYVYDAPIPTGGSVSGSVPARYEPYRNEFYKIRVNMAHPGLLSMEVTPAGGAMFRALEDVYYPAGQNWVYWDGRGPDGRIISGAVSVYYPVPKRVRPTAIHVLDAAPRVTGPGVAPNIEVKSDPYLVSHSYEQVTRMAYRISHDARVRFSLLPPGISDPADPSAIVLVDDELLQAEDAGGVAIDHVVEWRGYDLESPGDILVDQEGAYTFAIQARSTESQQSTLYRGVVNLYR